LEIGSQYSRHEKKAGRDEREVRHTQTITYFQQTGRSNRHIILLVSNKLNIQTCSHKIHFHVSVTQMSAQFCVCDLHSEQSHWFQCESSVWYNTVCSKTEP